MILIIFAVIIVVEFATTTYGIQSGKGKEIHPILNKITDKFGLLAMYASKSIVGLLIVGFASAFGFWWFYGVVGIPMLVISVNNVKVLVKEN